MTVRPSKKRASQNQSISFATLAFVLLLPLIIACQNNTPAEPDFSVISSPQVPVSEQITPTIGPPPTNTPEPVPTATPEPDDGRSVFQMAEEQIPTSTPTYTPVFVPPTPTNTAEAVPTNTPAPPTGPPRPVAPPDEPRLGGSWDMEDGFEFWVNPHGDNCSGSQVALGWQGFTSQGQYGSSCFVLNEYAPNVFAGRYSQEVTFDFVDSTAGLYRTFDSQPNHEYQVTARIKHVHTLPAMQFFFGYDLSGGTAFDAETVQWAGWDEFAEDMWITHVETFVATGPRTTIYIRGLHPTAAQGGATYIDAVEVIDLGE